MPTQRSVASNRQHAIAAIFEGLASPPILFLLQVCVVLRPVDEHAHPGDRTALVVEIGLKEYIGRWGVLGEIGKAELSLVKVIEKRTLE